MTRDARFVAVHRGGTLDKARHRRLASWAADCAEHVLPLFQEEHPDDDRPRLAIEAARAWARDEISVGAARAAAVAAHAAARDASCGATRGAGGAAQKAARAAGHGAATAHMADHSLGAAGYALRAVRLAAGPDGAAAAADRERAWQHERLLDDVRELVLSAQRSRPGLA